MEIEDSDKQDDFRPRPYQEQLLNLVKEQNTILYLPTGSGKTFIAVMLIKEMSGSLKKNKHTFFMVNTVALVNQQAAYIKRHSHHSVGEYSGDMNVDFWSKDKWQTELQDHQIMVMTCQIFLNLLMHGYIKLQDVNLLIFDECHHAVQDQPMRQIMKQFEYCPQEQQPRILGLTATLLNGNCKSQRVVDEVRALEKTFLSKVATCEDIDINRYSANPDVKLVKYDDKGDTPGLPVLERGIKLVEDAQKFVDNILFESDEVVPDVKPPSNTILLNTNRGKTNKKLRNLLTDVILHMKMLGMFGGSYACLAHIIQLERIRKKAADKLTKDVFTALITSLVAVRKLFEDEMSDCTEKSKIHKYSSMKMLTLFEVLKTAMPKDNLDDSCDEDDTDELSDDNVSLIISREKKKKKDPKFCTLVFVERRFTAKIVFSVLKDLKKADEDFHHINPDFIVGFNNNPFNDTREGTLEKKWGKECIMRFVNGKTNVLVASDVLEEGIDIQKCNLVVKFDMPKNYRSYVQSKGRARFQNSKYYILVPLSDWNSFSAKFSTYTDTESAVQKLLVGHTEEHQEQDEPGLYDHLVPPYITSCSKVTLASAIPLINRYCSMLLRDKFTQLTPLWYIRHYKDNKSVYLQLPMLSPLHDTIEGQKMPSKKLAKRAVALQACILLHKMGELNENLLPKECKDSPLDHPELYPLYVEVKAGDIPQPGSNKRKRHYCKEFPVTLNECRPKAGMELYLHVIKQQPVYPRPDDSNSRKLAFYNLLHCSEGYAILSAKPMPKLCDFPIYMNVGELRVHIENNAVRLHLTHADIEDLETFNAMVFGQLLKLMKPFVMVDKDNRENSYFVVPTCLGDDGCYKILWDIVRQHRSIPDIQEPSMEERRTLQVTEQLFQDSVVAPWYRGMVTDQSYIVTRVCLHLTPASPFPSQDYSSYEAYYRQKYKLSIMSKGQPLLEVKAISNKINCLRPRSTKTSTVTSKRKRHEMQEDFEENLVAEFCMRFEFPSVLWVKATCLPTILHRVTHLLQAEELRQKVAREIGVGCTELPPGVEWKPLSVDHCCIDDGHRQKSPQQSADVVTGVASMHITEPPNPLTSTLFDWGGDKEPVDIDRNMEDVTLVEVLNYDDFISKPLSNKLTKLGLPSSGGGPHCIIADSAAIHDDTPEHDVPQIAILNTGITGIGPEQCEVLQALTSASANDILNLERLETLGDSFLKFMSSLFLFRCYKDMDEGALTVNKGKMIGNLNLYYCGQNQHLGGIMKVHDFGPTSDWIPPSMCVDRKLQEMMLKRKLSPNILYELVIPKEEQLSGELSQKTFTDFMNKLKSVDEDQDIHSSMENFLSVQTVSDKTIADGVEALVGVYLKASGIRGALKLLVWFQILPPSLMASPESLLDVPPPTARLSHGEIEMHLEGANDLEHQLGYKFRDRSFLLQALTHASCYCNRTTDCYQRLEFLGDAILDFLITCHIYESCGLLTPGELTDLRSALVNNVTFASLTVRCGFHKFMKYMSPKLMDMVDNFVKFQEERGHVINEEVLILLEEEDTCLAEAVEVPKILGDVFESIAAAIYLDSGLNLQEVWHVYYRLMKAEIAQFSKCVPKQPVRLLYEWAPQQPKFLPCKEVNDSFMVSVGVHINGKRRWFHGFGETKARAKRAAAKCALRGLHPKK